MTSASLTNPGYLTVGVDASPPPPMQLGDPASDTFDGYEVELVRAIADRLGLVPQFRSALWSTILAELGTGHLDVVCSAATVTPERERAFTFGRPYLPVELVAVIEAGSAAATLDELKGLRVAVRTGTLAEDHATTRLAPTSVMTTEFNIEAYDALRAGRVDVVVDDSPIAAWFVADTPGLRVLAPIPGTASHYAMVYAKSQRDLAASMDMALEELELDGSLRRIAGRWFGATPLAGAGG